MAETELPISNDSRDLEAIFAISAAAAQCNETDLALDEVIALARAVFVFDNVVLYLRRESTHLEPSYARAIGRGRSEEADLAWGEAIANQTIQSAQAVIREEINAEIPSQRMKQRYFLGLPLIVGDDSIGALIFVRYGNPAFAANQLPMANFIAAQIAQILERERLMLRLVILETERQVERLQDDFVSTISHELRTPLGFIKGYATTLLREDTVWDEATRREFLAIIDDESDRLRELIDNLLDSSRLQAGTLQMEFQPIRLDTLLRDMALRASSRHENIPVELDVGAQDVQVQADPTRLAQVFDNLFSNAAKYAAGSKVILSLSVEDSEAHITVRDFGPGIAPEHLGNIFTRFYRVPNPLTATRGTGLGLFICRRIIRTHGGEIAVESTPGQGTAFHIYLPRLSQTGEPLCPLES